MRGMPFGDSLRLTAGKAANLADDEFRNLFEITGNLGLRNQNLTVQEYRNLLKEGSDMKVAGKTQAGVNDPQGACAVCEGFGKSLLELGHILEAR